MKTAHVSKKELVLHFDFGDSLPPPHLKMLLDELKSQPILELYRPGMRSHSDFDRESKQTRVLIYLTPQMVSLYQAIEILRRWKFEVHDAETGRPITSFVHPDKPANDTRKMDPNDAQAIANIQLMMALRLDKANRLEKIIASAYNSPHRKSLARERLAKLRQALEADKNELERIKAAD
jgi:hypothetical protein